MKFPIILTLLCSILLLSSCGDIKEEITIQEDGSGEYILSTDMIPMMRNMMKGFATMAMTEEEKLDSNAVNATIEEMLWKDFKGEIDSTLDISSKIPEDIKKDPSKMALINQTHAFMRGSKEKGYMLMGMNYSFKSSKDFTELQKLIEEGQKKDKKGSLFGESKTETKITNTSFYRSSKQTKPAKEEDPSVSAMMKMFDSMNMYTTINFPRKIKTIQVSTYEIVSKTEKSVTLKYNLLKALETGNTVTIDIALE